MTLEETIYWIVLIFFALPMALGALVYIWRTFARMIRGPQPEEDEDDDWRDSHKHRED